MGVAEETQGRILFMQSLKILKSISIAQNIGFIAGLFQVAVSYVKREVFGHTAYFFGSTGTVEPHPVLF